jgi:hypothetical protein
VWAGLPDITAPVRLVALTGAAIVALVIVWTLFNPWRRARLRGP